MLGVTGGDKALYGVFDLNQGVYTVMSYNESWELHPDGPSPFTGGGHRRRLGRVRSARVRHRRAQERYGVNNP